LGRALGELLGPGSVVAFTGDLGSGKSVAIQGVARGLGFAGAVSSPSFVIVKEYDGRLPIYHVDLYRFSDDAALEEIGYREIFWGEAVALVEWAERASAYLPRDRLDVSISIEGPSERELVLDAHGAEAARVLDGLARRWRARSGDADSDH